MTLTSGPRPPADETVTPDDLPSLEPEGTELHWLTSSVAILVLGLVLCAGGLFIPIEYRFVLWPLAVFVPGHAIVCAVFGDHLDFGGFRRVGLSMALTLAAYPMMALTGIVVGRYWTHGTVVGGTLLLTVACAFVQWRREVRAEQGLVAEPDRREEPAEVGPSRLRVTELLLPGGSIVLALLIAWASITVFPRKAPDEFSSISLEGTWALTARAVPANPSNDVSVTFRIDNETTRVQVYVVTAAIVDGPGWETKTQILEPGQAWVDTVSGRIADGRCRSRLEIDMEVVGGDEDHFPLAVFFRDSTIECS
ncbi:MAG: DUF1616 domain-containing protein [Actinomycetota bacterium]